MHQGRSLLTYFLHAALLASVSNAAIAQQQPPQQQASRGTISGTVKDADTGQPLALATVQVVGTSFGATSGTDGRYVIANVNPGIVTINVKRIGYSVATKADLRVTAGATTTSDILLSQQALILNSVVSTGLSDPASGTKTPFSVATVGQEKLQVPALGSPLEALIGKVASLRISSVSGAPGSDVVIQIRNPLSFRGNTQPMIIIDGIIQLQDDPTLDARGITGNPIDINPELIDNIEIVRGAAAAAIYGQRAANGVINITTKRGADVAIGTTRFTLSNELGMQQLGKFLPLNNHHRLLVNEDNQFIDSFGRVLTDRNFVSDPDQIIDNTWGVPTYNNFEGLFGIGSTLQNNVNLSQSSLSTNFSMSGGVQRETGVVKTPKGGLNRENVGTSIDYRGADKVTLGLGLYYNHQFQRMIASGDSIFTSVLDMSPDVNIKAINPATGDYYPFPDDVNTNRFNPLYFEPKADGWEKRIGVQVNGTLTFRPISILTLTGTGGYGRSDRDAQIEFTPRGALRSNNNISPGTYAVGADLDETFNTNTRASLLAGFGAVTARANLTLSAQAQKRHGFQLGGDTLQQNEPDIDFTQGEWTRTENKRDQRSLGISGGVAFDYDSRLIVDLLYRTDGNSLLPPETRWRSNGRASFAWSIAEESWWPAPDFTLFKLRYSIGTAGNNPLYTDKYEVYRQTTSGRIGKNNTGNDQLKPEEVTEQEFGLDVAFRNRYSLALTYVRNNVKNAIRSDPIVSYTGFEAQIKNLGDLQGDSYEATLESQWINKRNLRWSSTLVVDRSREKITSYPRRCQAANLTSTLSRECEGYVFGQMYGLRLVRDVSQLNPIHSERTGHASTLHQFDMNDDGLLVPVGETCSTPTTCVPGSWTDSRWGQTVIIDNISYLWGLPIREGVYTEAMTRTASAQVVLGMGLPTFAFGFGNQLQMGKWSAHVQTTGQVGGLIFNRYRMTRYNLEIHPDVDQFGKAEYAKKPRTYYTSTSTATASGSTSLTGNNTEAVDFFLENGTFLKISELRIGYRLDGALPLLRKIGMTGGTVAIAARNLYTFTGYSGLDPEVSGSTNSTTSRVDNVAYPRYRTLSASLRLIF